jgi:hypothetical protein
MAMQEMDKRAQEICNNHFKERTLTEMVRDTSQDRGSNGPV